MTDVRPFAERRGEYAAAKFGEPRTPRDPQSFTDSDEQSAWQAEFEHTVAPALDAPRIPVVALGYGFRKGPR